MSGVEVPDVEGEWAGSHSPSTSIRMGGPKWEGDHHGVQWRKYSWRKYLQPSSGEKYVVGLPLRKYSWWKYIQSSSGGSGSVEQEGNEEEEEAGAGRGSVEQEGPEVWMS